MSADFALNTRGDFLSISNNKAESNLPCLRSACLQIKLRPVCRQDNSKQRKKSGAEARALHTLSRVTRRKANAPASWSAVVLYRFPIRDYSKNESKLFRQATNPHSFGLLGRQFLNLCL